MADFFDVLQANQTPWTGLRYQLLPASLSLAAQANLLLAEIGEIIFPTVEIQYTTIPSLSTIERKIPSRKITGDLTLRGGVFRNHGFFKQLEAMSDVLKGTENYNDNIVDLMVVEFEIGPIAKAIPIASWVCVGCQAKSYTPAPANANQSGIPFQELVMSVDDFKLIG